MKQMAQFILDGSVALAWYFRDEKDAYADAIAASLTNAEVFVPALWHLEIANAVVMRERRNRSTIAQAAQWLGFLSSLTITVDSETGNRAWTDTLNLARGHTLTAYDAAYLELAMRLRLPIATLDDKLEAAAKIVGVPLYKP